MPRFDADWIESLLNPERRGSPPATEILVKVGLGAGATVADIGCGPGFLTIPAARLTGPTGRVYAVDVEPQMLDLVGRRSAESGLTWIETRQSSGATIPLGDAVADYALCALVLHDLDDPPALVREIDRITRSSGRIVIIEWMPSPTVHQPHRISSDTLHEMLRDVGRLSGEAFQLSERQYMVVTG
jgi:ubiquinone/menaquinone biosynthesis C-methylase UbiE